MFSYEITVFLIINRGFRSSCHRFDQYVHPLYLFKERYLKKLETRDKIAKRAASIFTSWPSFNMLCLTNARGTVTTYEFPVFHILVLNSTM